MCGVSGYLLWNLPPVNCLTKAVKRILKCWPRFSKTSHLPCHHIVAFPWISVLSLKTGKFFKKSTRNVCAKTGIPYYWKVGSKNGICCLPFRDPSSPMIFRAPGPRWVFWISFLCLKRNESRFFIVFSEPNDLHMAGIRFWPVLVKLIQISAVRLKVTVKGLIARNVQFTTRIRLPIADFAALFSSWSQKSLIQGSVTLHVGSARSEIYRPSSTVVYTDMAISLYAAMQNVWRSHLRNLIYQCLQYDPPDRVGGVPGVPRNVPQFSPRPHLFWLFFE